VALLFRREVEIEVETATAGAVTMKSKTVS
jgi:hypothetical protein